MSIRESTYRTTFKETLPATDIKTHRKNQYSFASPFRNSETKEEKLSTMKFRSPLRDQQIQDYNRIKSQLKRGLEMAKENISMNHLSQYVPIQQYNILNQQHRYETERLLMEIQKLHETIGQVERAKNYEIQRVKQEYQAAAFLNMSNVRQVNASQVDLLQGQLRKLKEQLNDKSSEYQNTIKRHEREIKHLKNENVRLNAQIKTLIQQKNTQLQNHQRSSTESFNNLTQQYEKKFRDLQESHNRDIAQLNRIIEQNEVRLKQQLGFNQNIESQNAKLYAQMQDKRIQGLKKELQLDNESREKYAEIKRSLQQEFEQSYEEIHKNYETKQQILENEILKLKQFLKQKNEDRQKLIELHQERLNFVNQMKEEIERQNQQLKDKLKEITNKHLQQQELLKVKMAALHQTDLTILVKTYEDKIENHVAQIKDRQDTISRLRTNLYEETNHRYQMRKKYSIEVSKLNAKVIKLRSGLHAMETDFKEKIENERSMMLLTSQNMIKEVESKTSGNKFYQTQLRKLQQLFDFHQKQTNADDYQVEERIRIATQELHRLSAKVLQQKNSHIETQKTYKSIVQAKDQQISKLQHQLDNFQHPEFDNSKQIKLIQELKTQIHDKNLQNGKLKDQLDLLQKKIHIMNQQLDQYHMEHEITQQQAKKQYQKIANQNMEQFKVFYENRIQSLEREKEDLKELISSKQEKITSLVQKYQQLQKTMKSTLAKIKKRTDLQNRVLNIGLDNNLVKNMAEIVKNDMAS